MAAPEPVLNDANRSVVQMSRLEILATLLEQQSQAAIQSELANVSDETHSDELVLGLARVRTCSMDH